jgi:hypothetical protein
MFPKNGGSLHFGGGPVGDLLTHVASIHDDVASGNHLSALLKTAVLPFVGAVALGGWLLNKAHS